MLHLVLSSCFFIGIHLFLSGTRLRGKIAAKIGEKSFQGLFSLLSIIGLVWLIWAYRELEFIGLWGQLPQFNPIVSILMPIAFLFLAIGATTPNPTSIGREGVLKKEVPAQGIVRITRHPVLWGIAIWSLSHFIVNGDVASAFLFGTMLIVSVAGTFAIDAKMHGMYGEEWDNFAKRTSNVPFIAIVQKRNIIVFREIKPWRFIVALGVYLGFLFSHTWLFGASPF